MLAVEDDPLIALALEETLAAAGVVVKTIATVAGALAVAQVQVPDLAILDIRLPGQHDGVTGAGPLRTIAPLLPILFLTGEVDHAVLMHVAEIPGAVFLRKPAHPQSLLARIDQMLAQAPQPALPA